MKYQLEITTLLVPVNVHQLFEKCEWPELNSFDKEMVEDYFSDLVNGIQTDEALDDWKLTIVLYIGTYLGANHISIRKHGITDTATKEKVLTIGIPLPCSKTVRWGVKKKNGLLVKYRMKTIGEITGCFPSTLRNMILWEPILKITSG